MCRTEPPDLLALTPSGPEAYSRLIAAERDELDHLLQGWSPDQEAELAALLTQMAERLLTDETGNHKLLATGPSSSA